MGIIKLRGFHHYNINLMVPKGIDKLLNGYSGNAPYWRFLKSKSNGSPTYDALVNFHKGKFSKAKSILMNGYIKNPKVLKYLKGIYLWYSGKKGNISHPFISYPNGKINGNYLYGKLRGTLTYYDYITYTGIPEQKLSIPTSISNPHDAFTLYALETFFKRILAPKGLKLVLSKKEYYPHLPMFSIRHSHDIVALMGYSFYREDYLMILWISFLAKLLMDNRVRLHNKRGYSAYNLFDNAYKWAKGRLNFGTIHQYAINIGLLGVFDDVFIYEKVANQKAFICFSEKLKIIRGFVHRITYRTTSEQYLKNLNLFYSNITQISPSFSGEMGIAIDENFGTLSVEDKISIRGTYLRRKSALIGLAYALLFCLRKNIMGEIVLNELKLKKFFEDYKHCIYKNPNNINKKIQQDISAIKKVINKGKIDDKTPLDLDGYEIKLGNGVKTLWISNSNNFDACARYGYVLEFEDGCWKDPFLKAAQDLKQYYLTKISSTSQSIKNI